MHLLRLAVVMLAFAAPASAGLVETHFPGKTEAQVADEFEAGLPAYLSARLKDTTLPVRMYALVAKNTEVFVQLTAVNEGSSEWTTLVNSGWYKATANTPCGYAMEPHGKAYTIVDEKLPPAEIATWFSPKSRAPAELVALACWLASRSELQLANAELAALAETKTDLKADIAAWLAAKNGWSGELEAAASYDLKHNEEVRLLLSKDAKATWLRALEAEAKDALKDLERLQGNDTKSKPGYRKNSPRMRLELLQNYLEGFNKAYGDTSYIQKKAKDMKAIGEAIANDLSWIEEEKLVAERKGIDGHLPECAKHYDLVQRADPWNPDIVHLTATAFYNAAKVTNGGLKAEDPNAAKRSALLYERLIEIYPLQLSFYNYAGLNWLATGDKSLAKQHHQEVLRLTDAIKELSENDRKNRKFAEDQLKLIK